MKCSYCNHECSSDALICPSCRNLVYEDKRLNALRELDALENIDFVKKDEKNESVNTTEHSKKEPFQSQSPILFDDEPSISSPMVFDEESDDECDKELLSQSPTSLPSQLQSQSLSHPSLPTQSQKYTNNYSSHPPQSQSSLPLSPSLQPQNDNLQFMEHNDLIKQLIFSISKASTSIIIVTPYISIKNDVIIGALGAIKRGVRVGVYTNFVKSLKNKDVLSYIEDNKVQLNVVDELASKICIIDNSEIYVPNMSFTGDTEKQMIAFGIYSTCESLIFQAISHIINLEETTHNYKNKKPISEMEDKRRDREEQFLKSRQKTEFLLSTLSNLQKSNFEILRTWRNKKARTLQIAPFIIAHNEWLIQIVLRNPQTKEELATVKGFGKTRIEKYGKEIMIVVRSFVD